MRERGKGKKRKSCELGPLGREKLKHTLWRDEIVPGFLVFKPSIPPQPALVRGDFANLSRGGRGGWEGKGRKRSRHQICLFASRFFFLVSRIEVAGWLPMIAAEPGMMMMMVVGAEEEEEEGAKTMMIGVFSVCRFSRHLPGPTGSSFT